MNSVVRYRQSDISPIVFYKKHLEGNVPCVFECDVTADWKCRREWLDASGHLDLEKLGRLFGESVVPVMAPDGDVSEMPLSDYIDRLQTDSSDGLYLKDWHFQLARPSYGAYTVPEALSSDWMNEYWMAKADARQADYRFLYLGPPGSSTPIHADVLRSFSWSANVAGRKRWLLLPPGAESRFPPDQDLCNLTEEEQRKSGMISLIQEAGEIIFVPSNWHHQVINLELTLSINHNWLNAANFGSIWAYAEQRLTEVEREIADSRDIFGEKDWRKQCQTVLKADIGIDFRELLKLLEFIKHNRQTDSSNSSFAQFIHDCDIEVCDQYIKIITDRCVKLQI